MTANPQTTFRALADPTRRGILTILADGDKSVGEVAGHFEMTRPAVKKHLQILEEGRLISVRTRGRERINSINPDGFLPAVDWLNVFDTFWSDRLSALKTAIEKDFNT
jgi:DNA-binding transcriptional ArsR family regulator